MLIESKHQNPDEPGLVCYETIIPDDMKMNPECPCQVRMCPKHGFCIYCKIHHEELFRSLGTTGPDCACRRFPENITYLDNAFTCEASCEEKKDDFYSE